MTEPSDMQRVSRPWGLYPTLGLSFLVLIAFFLRQTVVFLGLLMVQTAQQPDARFETLVDQLDQNGFVLAIATLISTPICLALIVAFAQFRANPAWRYLGLRCPSRRDVGVWCLITVGYVVTLDLLKSLTDRPVTPDFVHEIYASAHMLPLLYLAVGVMAPVFEEIFMRGFIFQGVRHSELGPWGAVILSALLWAMIHTQYDWYDILSIFTFGLLLGTARFKTHSTYVAIAMHMLNNVLALLQVALTQAT